MHEDPYKASESTSPTSALFLRSSEQRPYYGSRVVLVQRVRAPTTVEGGLPESVSDLKSTSTPAFFGWPFRPLAVQTDRSKCESPGKHSVWAGKAHAATLQLIELSYLAPPSSLYLHTRCVHEQWVCVTRKWQWSNSCPPCR